jgi:hypothetical protein
MKHFRSIIAAALVSVSRLGALPANVSPLGALGFFNSNPLYFIVSFVAFDYLVGGFYRGVWFNYVGFMLYWFLGRLAAKNIKLQIIGLPLASLLFFLISNLGVWIYWYAHTLQGLATCYLLAVPFYRNTLIGDLVFGYGYLMVKYWWDKRLNHQEIKMAVV